MESRTEIAKTATAATASHWRRLAAVLVLLTSAFTAHAGPAPEYEQSSINLPSSASAVETRFDLNGDGQKDVLALFQRRILIFFQRAGKFPTAPDVEIGAGDPIPKTYAALSIGKLRSGPGMQLLLLGETGVDFLTISQLRASGDKPIEPQPLLRKPLDLSSGPELIYLDAAAVDLNSDGRTELVLPVAGQLDIYESGTSDTLELRTRVPLPTTRVQRTTLQHEPALFGSLMLENSAGSIVQTLPRPDRWHSVRFLLEDSTPPFIFADFNRDKRWDILTPKGIASQSPGGHFDFSPSDTYSRIASAIVPQNRADWPGGCRLMTAPNLVDFNGDGILDTFKVDGTTARLSPRTDISIFLGKPNRTFGTEPDSVLHTRDFAYSDVIPVGDLNGDGAQDIGLFHFDFQPSSASSQLKAYIRNGLDGELRFYLWDKAKNRFPDNFAFKHRVTVNYGIYGARQWFQQQVVMNQDMDGDHLPDLVMKTAPREVSVFANTGGTGISGSAAATLQSPTPFSSIQVQDMNGDDKGDVVVSGYLDSRDDRTIYTFFISK